MYESMLNYPSSLAGEFERLRRELGGIFGDARGLSSIRSVAAGAWPQVNIGRTANSLEIYAFAPGIDASKLDIALERGVLRIAGERPTKLPQREAGVHVYANERVSGSFTRAISLPDDIDPDQVKAQYRDGVLQIAIGLKPTAQPKRITLQ